MSGRIDTELDQSPSAGRDPAKLSPIPPTPADGRRHLLLVPELFRAEGGIARVSRHYLQAVADANPHGDLHLVVLNDADLPIPALARYHAQHACTTAAARSKWRFFRAAWQASRGAKQIDVLCTHLHQAPVAWLLAKANAGLVYDVVLHGIEVWRDVSKSSRWAMQGARHLLCISEFTRNEVRQRYPELTDKLLVFPNALDPGFPIGVDAHASIVPHRILAVSRLASHDAGKGIDHLIEALPAVLAQIPDATLHIIGEGADRPRLQALANASDAKDRIQFLGYADEATLKAELAACTLFALPSCKEGFGLVYLEAMAAGKPCLAAQAGGAPEVVTPTCGVLVPYGGGEPLAAGLVSGLQREWPVDDLLDRARAFSFERFAQRCTALLTPSPVAA